MRWRLRLSEFDFEIRYKNGVGNTQADALSRLRTLSIAAADPDNTDVPSFPDVPDTPDFVKEDFALDDNVLVASTDHPQPHPDAHSPISFEELVK